MSVREMVMAIVIGITILVGTHYINRYLDKKEEEGMK